MSLSKNKNMQGWLEKIQKISPGNVYRDINLSDYSTWKIGGKADILVSPTSEDELSAIWAYVNSNDIPSLVIGRGSNLLFDDAGFRGVVVHIGQALSRCNVREDGFVSAEAGMWTPAFVRRVCCSGFKGCEHAIGIPGSLGGLVVMNGGTSRKGIGDQLVELKVVKESGEIQILSSEQCDFSYRKSALQGSKSIVVNASFQYKPASSRDLRHDMINILKDRNKKFPRKLPNCGSVFLSDPEMYATVGPPGKVIEDAGLKGVSQGGAQVSMLHANFIVNNGLATSYDILALIAKIRRIIFERTGYKLECEVRHVSPSGQVVPAHISAEAVI